MLKRLGLAALILLLALGLATWAAMAPVTSLYRKVGSEQSTLQAFDRSGLPLSFHYHTRWNHNDHLPLYRMPPLLVEAMLRSEDKRFYDHGGVDWRARGSALVTNLTHARRIRGASSITEQVVRMLHPRPRGFVAKWLEGFEAMQLESALSKEEILEFYLNQVPYAAGRRGVVQAARYYFGRDPDTLSSQEILALVVLVRAPSSYDLHMHPTRISSAVNRLALQLLPPDEAERIAATPFTLSLPESPVDASHFLRYVREQPHTGNSERFTTTLDAALQRNVQQLLDQRVEQLAKKKVKHAAAIVIDHRTGEVLAWAVGGTPTDIDIITTARQPGSAMKPFLYALALEKGWNAATALDDSPLSEAIGTGLHRFRNYSQRYYGKISLREALGNSLNIPALLTSRFVTPVQYLATLHALGFASLSEEADMYEEGLALGSGEVTPLELATAYSALARGGAYQPASVLLQDSGVVREKRRIFTPETSSIISDILSDPWARSREFGRASLLNLPVQTAVKTGTSTDYHDAWAAGYNYRYTVVVWMGNLDRSPMDGITGSTGPALVLRSIFAELTRDEQTQPLPFSARLERHEVCADAAATPPCPMRSELFAPGTYVLPAAQRARPSQPELVQPTDKLRLAYDPRIPAELQQFQFRMRGIAPGTRVRWELNGTVLADDEMPSYDWQVVRGSYRLAVTLIHEDGSERALAPVRFTVK